MSKLDCASVNREVFLRTCRDAFFKRYRRDRLFAERKTGKDRDSFVNPRDSYGCGARANANTENDDEEMIFDDDDDAENLYYLSYSQRAKSTKRRKRKKERKRGRKDTNHNHAQLVKVVIPKLYVGQKLGTW